MAERVSQQPSRDAFQGASVTADRVRQMLRAAIRAAAAAAFLLVAASLVPGDGAYSRVERLLSYLGPPAPASAQIRSVPSTAGSILFEFFQSRNLEVEGVSIDLDQSVRPSAQVEERRFASTALGEDRSYWVYLPPGYKESRERYPALYLLHGMSQGHRWCGPRWDVWTGSPRR